MKEATVCSRPSFFSRTFLACRCGFEILALLFAAKRLLLRGVLRMPRWSRTVMERRNGRDLALYNDEGHRGAPSRKEESLVLRSSSQCIWFLLDLSNECTEPVLFLSSLHPPRTHSSEDSTILIMFYYLAVCFLHTVQLFIIYILLIYGLYGCFDWLVLEQAIHRPPAVFNPKTR